MKKEEIRKEFFKLRMKGHSYAQCKKILKAQFSYEIAARTLQRWSERLNKTEWDLRDTSKRPKTISRKITPEIEKKIMEIKNQTGWGKDKIEDFVDLGHTTINKILNKYNLCEKQKNRRKRIKYIRWQRKHPNSLWQMDVSDQKIKDKYCFAVIDDCSRYCLGLFDLNRVTAAAVTKILDELGRVHGYPKQILTDNGSVFGLRSRHSKFDIWCRRKRIKHIRTAIHSPTTTGKIERFFKTLASELNFCKCPEDFRMRYNHIRPHTSLEKTSPSGVYFAFHKLF